MRTNIEIDDELVAAAMKITGLKTKKATIDAALRKFVKLHQQKQALENMTGLGWEGDLDEMRRGWTSDPR